MANEITLSVSLAATKGAVALSADASGSVTMSGTQVADLTQTINTSSTALNLGAVSGTPSALLVTNLDTANYVEVDSSSSFNAFPQKIPAGATLAFLPETGTVYAKANTSAVQVRVRAC